MTKTFLCGILLVVSTTIGCSGATNASNDTNFGFSGDTGLGESTGTSMPGGGTSATSEGMPDRAGPVVRINEVTSDDLTQGMWAGAGDAIEIVNIGMATADLSGWMLSDDSDFAADKTFVFAEGTRLEPGAFMVLVKLDDASGQGDYPFGISSSKAETLVLAAAGPQQVDTVSIEAGAARRSWCRIPDGEGAWQACRRSFGASNEQSGGGEGFGTTSAGQGTGGDATTGDSTSSHDTGGAYDGIVINELSSSDADPIEIYNAGRRAVDLSGWILTDGLMGAGDAYDPDSDMNKLQFSDGTVLAPGQRLLLERGDPPGHPFGLAREGDRVALIDDGLVEVDFVEYGADEAVQSYCRLPDGPTGAWQPGCTPSFGQANES